MSGLSDEWCYQEDSFLYPLKNLKQQSAFWQRGSRISDLKILHNHLENFPSDVFHLLRVQRDQSTLFGEDEVTATAKG